MTRHYCSYFDHRYLPRALAMIRSLRRFESASRFWVLCLDDQCLQLLAKVKEPNVTLISLQTFMRGDDDLAAARKNRSLVEFYFTCTPSLVRYVLQRSSPEDSVTYVDADLFFFSDPDPLYRELGTGSVSVIPHRFTEVLKDRERYGKYNVGWLTFRNTESGRAVAEWWRSRCNEWCFDRLEDDRFADQKYLERFGQLFGDVVELAHEGANVAPWNIGRYRLMRRDGIVCVNGRPLVFFHFHALKSFGPTLYRAPHRAYRAPFGYAVRKWIYRPYVRELATITRELRQHGLEFSKVLTRGAKGGASRSAKLKRAVDVLVAIARRELVMVVAGRVI